MGQAIDDMLEPHHPLGAVSPSAAASMGVTKDKEGFATSEVCVLLFCTAFCTVFLYRSFVLLPLFVAVRTPAY